MPEYWINSFAAGELGPRVYGRMDLPQYRAGCRRLENMLVLPEGGVTRRPGTTYVTSVKDNSKSVRLFVLQHSALEATVLEVGHQYIRFYKDGAPILDGATPYEIVSPYAEADLPDVDIGQWGNDTLYIVHPDYAPRKLARTSDTSWAISTPEFTGITTSTSYTISTVDTTNDGVTLVGTPTLVDSLAVRMFIVSDGGSDALPGGIADDKTVYYVKWNSTHSIWELYPTLADHAAGTNKVDLSSTGTGTLALFAVEDFRLDDHFPRFVTSYEQRMVMGGPNYDPNAIFGSQIMDPESFANTEGTDADGWQHNLYRSQFDDVLWAIGDTALLAGATNALWRIGGAESILSAANTPVIRAQSGVGCSAMKPVLFQEFIVFAERGGRRIRSTSYNQDVEKHVTEDMTQLSPHITESGVKEMTYSQLPFPILWAAREDGKVITLSFSRAMGVAAWSEHDFSGEVESVVAVPHSSEATGLHQDDRVWFVVKRTINGSVERHVEYIDFAGWRDPTYARYVDSSVSFTGVGPVTITGITAADPAVVTVDDATGLTNGDQIRINGCETFTELNANVYQISGLSGATFNLIRTDGATNVDTSSHSQAESGANAYLETVTVQMTSLSHLEGETVSSLVDGGSIADEQVASGTISLDRHGKIVVTGLYVRPVIQPMPLAAQPTSKKRINEMYIRFFESGAVKLGPREDKLQPFTFRGASHQFGQSSEVFTGSRMIEFAGGYSHDGDIFITQDYPLPLTILSVAAEVSMV